MYGIFFSGFVGENDDWKGKVRRYFYLVVIFCSLIRGYGLI